MSVHYNPHGIRPVLGMSTIFQHLMSSGPLALSLHIGPTAGDVRKFFFSFCTLIIPPAQVFGNKRGFHLKPASCSSDLTPSCVD